MDESVFTRELVNSLKVYGWAEHIIPSAYGMRNTPDILACVQGHPIAIECKMIKIVPIKEREHKYYKALLKYGFTKGQEAMAATMALSGYLTVGLINIRPLGTALIVPIKESLTALDYGITPAIESIGRGTWDLKHLWEYLSLIPS